MYVYYLFILLLYIIYLLIEKVLLQVGATFGWKLFSSKNCLINGLNFPEVYFLIKGTNRIYDYFYLTLHAHLDIHIENAGLRS